MHRNHMTLPLFTPRASAPASRASHALQLVRAALLALLIALFAAVPAASAAVPGLQRVVSPPTTGSNSTQSAIATCPVGTKVIGTGGEVIGPTGRVVLRRVIPSSNLASVTAAGAEINGGTTSTWTVTAYAICASATAVPDVELLQLNSAVDSERVKSANINRLLGLQGAWANGAANGYNLADPNNEWDNY